MILDNGLLFWATLYFCWTDFMLDFLLPSSTVAKLQCCQAGSLILVAKDLSTQRSDYCLFG